MRSLSVEHWQRLLVCGVGNAIGLALMVAQSQPLPAQEMSYSLKADQKFSYSMTITIDDDEKVITYRGNTHYTVQSANDEQIRLTYRGGLGETSQSKPSRRGNDGPFGSFPRGPRMMGPPSPFSRPAFAGKTQTINRIIMTPKGRVLSMEGDSQLPYLLGNVSLLPFEALPKGAEREWVLDSGVSISEQAEDRRPFGPFGPGGLSGNSDKNVQAASEITRYSFVSQEGNLIKVKKSNQLISPAADKESFDMSGAGVWTFDSQNHIPHALDMTAKLIVKDGNSSTTLPITIKYERLTEEAIAKMESDARLAQEEAKRRAEMEKTQAETPLTGEEKNQALTALKGQNREQIKQKLGELEKKSLHDNDAEITAAIERHLKHPDSSVAQAARKALMKWSSSFEKTEKLRKAYEGPGVVSSTDREVDSTTPLYVGQLLQAQEHGSFWHPVRIRALQPSGKVEVEFMQWGKPGRTAILLRRNLQLAPEELHQPARPAAMASGGSSGRSNLPQSPDAKASRTWSDASGRFKIDAVYQSVTNGSVQLLRPDGRSVNVPLEKLSPADQAHVKKLLDAEANAENPFEPK